MPLSNYLCNNVNLHYFLVPNQATIGDASNNAPAARSSSRYALQKRRWEAHCKVRGLSRTKAMQQYVGMVSDPTCTLFVQVIMNNIST